jgi:sucrose phosphorylase
VVDYFEVAPEYGTWDDVQAIGEHFDLMFDAVFNHLSSRSQWFQRFLQNDPKFRDFFVSLEGNPDLSMVTRPRALPLLTTFTTSTAERRIWTTFSADQVDLNLRNPEVLLALIEVLLFYVSRGARFIRLDAIAYLWKEIGTCCIHLPQTHRVIQLMRSVLNEVAPQVVLVTETNVPHAENVSYFGDGTNEAQMVYNFALPPLVVHSFRSGDASTLARWIAGLEFPSPGVTFFNFLASHDGIGLNPVRGILEPAEIEALVGGTLSRGGLISYKHNADGSRSPYEMNINFLDALASPDHDESELHLARKFLTAHAILLSLRGVPGIYFHSLFGSRGDPAAAAATRLNRRINRQKLALEDLETALASTDSLRARIFGGLRELLGVRRNNPAFSPQSTQEIIQLDPRVLILRRIPVHSPPVTCIHNVSGDVVELTIPLGTPEWRLAFGGEWSGTKIRLDPHGCAWVG